ncbi:hypothetical protein E2C01_028878 [Portunus trituberculatus]|uniref:Uncharacterized protein n=1 Tax=Portunus trituberculatus TaxID=210409 RepID=A0A5B7EPX0_PORTR|nr:hypothetical protein [Portunus trituberculatus]
MQGRKKNAIPRAEAAPRTHAVLVNRIGLASIIPTASPFTMRRNSSPPPKIRTLNQFFLHTSFASLFFAQPHILGHSREQQVQDASVAF